MAIYQPIPNPPTWEEFEARCRERIAKIRAAAETGLYANMYANDVEWLLAVMKESHQGAYGWIMRRMAKGSEDVNCSGDPSTGSQVK